MEKVILQYGKDGALKYLSHLELMRALERSFRRAKIAITMSEGFNPRPKISYGPALPVGVGSRSEYLVVDVEDPIPENQLIEKLSYALPEGLSVYEAKYISKKQPSIISLVKSMAYRVEVEVGDITVLASMIDRLRSEERLLIKHKGREKWVETNQSILDWRIETTDGATASLYMLLAAGDNNSVRPEVVVNKLSETFPQLGGIEITGIYRIGQYANRNVPLIDIYKFYESVKMQSERDKS